MLPVQDQRWEIVSYSYAVRTPLGSRSVNGPLSEFSISTRLLDISPRMIKTKKESKHSAGGSSFLLAIVKNLKKIGFKITWQLLVRY